MRKRLGSRNSEKEEEKKRQRERGRESPWVIAILHDVFKLSRRRRNARRGDAAAEDEDVTRTLINFVLPHCVLEVGKSVTSPRNFFIAPRRAHRRPPRFTRGNTALHPSFAYSTGFLSRPLSRPPPSLSDTFSSGEPDDLGNGHDCLNCVPRERRRAPTWLSSLR